MSGFGEDLFGTSSFGGSGAWSPPLVPADWLVWPRNADLTRSLDPLSGLEKLTLVERYGPPDSWVIEGPAAALSVFGPGMGCILDRSGVQITSGNVTSIRRWAESSDGRTVERMSVAFASDLAALGRRIVFPDPAHALSSAISTFPAAYDLRSGTVEDLILGYVRSHRADLAQMSRRMTRLRVPASQGRGGTTQVTGRLDNLGVLVAALAEAGGLRVTAGHAEDAGGAWVDLKVAAVVDRSVDVRFGTQDSTATGLISEWSYELSAPTATRAIVAGGGDLAAREFLQLTDTAAEALWGDSWETVVDQRGVDPTSTDKLAELTREGQKALEEGSSPVAVSFVPTLGPDLVYRRDVNVGDLVGYDLPGLDPAEDRVREATTVVSAEFGQPTEQVSVVVGTPDAPTPRSQQQTAKALRAVTAIQRSK